MADTDSNALTKKVGPLPIWLWGLLVLAAAVAYSYAKKGKASSTDPNAGAGSMAVKATGAAGSQTPPTIIQNYPTGTTTTLALPVFAPRAHGHDPTNGLPLWTIPDHERTWQHRPRKPHRARKGGPGPQGPGHKPWEPGDRGFNGGEDHMPGGGPGAAEHHPERWQHQGDDGRRYGRGDHPTGRPVWNGPGHRMAGDRMGSGHGGGGEMVGPGGGIGPGSGKRDQPNKGASWSGAMGAMHQQAHSGGRVR